MRSWTFKIFAEVSSEKPATLSTRQSPPWQFLQPISVEVGATNRVLARTSPLSSSTASTVYRG